MKNDLCYRPSGEYSMMGVAVGLGLGFAAAVFLGILYGRFTQWLPIAGYVTFLLAIGLGFALGGVASFGIVWGRVRNVAVAAGVGGLVGLAGLYLAWAAWIWGIIDSANRPVSLSSLALHPATLGEAILKINQTGAWSIGGSTASGGTLWFLWTLEAVLVLVPAAFVAATAASGPFCERCHAWCVGHKSIATRRTPQGDEVLRVQRKDLDLLQAMGAPDPNALTFMRLDLTSCPKCHQMHTLSAANIHVSIDNKGKRSERESPVVSNLLLTEHEADAIRKLAAPQASSAA